MFRVKITRTAVKDIKKLDMPLREKVLNLLKQVASDPKSRGRALQGKFSGMWRYRLGKLRILVVIDEKNKVLEVHRVVWRKEAYEKGEK